MKNTIPRVGAVHDLSGYGRSSLTIILPVLSAMGIHVCPLPTAILSTQTTGFEHYVFHDLSDVMEKTIAHWQSLPLQFDSIYSGFLGSLRQIGIMENFLDCFQTKDQLITIDPVMGDEGSFYGPMDKQIVARMKQLAGRANLITPNYTEACFLLNHPYRQELSLQEGKDMLEELASLGPDKIIITSLPLKGKKGRNTLLAFDKERRQSWRAESEQIPQSYPGTGDLFASIMTGRLLFGDTLREAINRSVEFALHAIRQTYRLGSSPREGVMIEPSLPLLQNLHTSNYCKILS